MTRGGPGILERREWVHARIKTWWASNNTVDVTSSDKDQEACGYEPGLLILYDMSNGHHVPIDSENSDSCELQTSALSLHITAYVSKGTASIRYLPT